MLLQQTKNSPKTVTENETFILFLLLLTFWLSAQHTINFDVYRYPIPYIYIHQTHYTRK